MQCLNLGTFEYMIVFEACNFLFLILVDDKN